MGYNPEIAEGTVAPAITVLDRLVWNDVPIRGE